MLTKIKATIAELGPLPAALYATDRVFRLCRLPLRLFAYHLVAQPIADKPILARQPRRPLTLREIGADDPALRDMPLTPDVVGFRFAQGAACLALFEGAKLVGYLWFCTGGYEEDEVRCRYTIAPLDSTIWDFDVYLPPEQRSGFGFARLWDAANAWLSARGRAWTISRISAFNRASLAAHRRLGARTLGWALFVSIGSVQILMSSLRPWLHVSRWSRPQIRIVAPAIAGRDGDGR